MGKKSKIVLSIIAGLIILVYAAFLFVVPAVVNQGSFNQEIKKAAKEATGLEVELGELKVHTYPDLSVGVTVKNVKIKTSETKNLLKIKAASVKIPLFPLIFRKLEIADVKLDSPEIFLTRLKNGKYNIEEILENAQQQQNISKQKANAAINSKIHPEQSSIEPVFNGIDVLVKNYKINLTDKSAPHERHFVLKGDIFKVSNFNPEKYAKIVAKGEFLTENQPDITYNVSIATDLPLGQNNEKEAKNSTKLAKKVQKSSTKSIKNAQNFDPLDGLIKYGLKGNIAADLKLKNRGNIPEINGFLNFDKLSLKIDGKRLPDSNGKFKFSGKKIGIDSKLYITPESYLEIAGKINNLAKQDFDINVKSTEIQLNDIKKFANSFADALNIDMKPLNKIEVSGKLKADFNLKKDNYQGYLDLLGVRISDKDISRPLKDFNSKLKFNKNKVVFEDTSGFLGDIKFDVNGYVTSRLLSNITVNAPDINLKSVVNLINNSKMLADLRPQLKDFKNISGNISATAQIKGRLDKEIAPEININVGKISLYHIPSKIHISVTKGNIKANAKKADLNNVTAVISNSTLNISGEITDLAKVPNINIIANGKISAADIKKYSPKEVRQALKAGEDLPIAVKITGTPENMDLTAQTNIDNLAYIVSFDQPKGVSNIINIAANIKPDTIYLNDSGLFAGSNMVKDSSGFYNLASASKLLSIEGTINNYNSPKPYLDNVKVNISGLNLKLSEPEGKAQINGNLVVNGKTDAPKVLGTLSIRNITVPAFKFKANNIDVTLKDNEILVNTEILNFSGSNAKLSAVLENKLSPPFLVRSVTVNSDFIDIDKLSTAFQPASVGHTASAKADRSNTHSSKLAGTQIKPQDFPIIIRSGKFSAKKLVASKLINNNLFFDFAINPINRLSIRNFTARTGGGTISGIVNMNLKTAMLNMDLTADNMEVNALASTLAQTPNIIFGKMNGRIKLATMGQTPESMTQNAVGRVDFSITDGHLPELGSLSYLLSAKNLTLKGVTDSLLADTLQFNEAKETNHFDTLKGLVLVNRGALDIQEISMQGKYLSSFISGSLQMNSNYANLTILSKLSGKIVRKLGSITEISIDNLLRQLPGQWGQLIANQRLASEYPNRDRIPALNADPLPDDKDFAVKINGNINNPDSVRMFEWLPSLDNTNNTNNTN